MNIQNMKPTAESDYGEAPRPSNGEALRQPSAAGTRGASRSPEHAMARQALHELPSLSEERAAEIRRRIESGYYRRPEILDQIAERVASELNP